MNDLAEVGGGYLSIQSRILLVDDEPIVHETLGGFLRDREYEVVECQDPRDALQLLARQLADIVLIDLKMPHLDGMTLLQRIVERFPEVPAVIITGHGDMETVLEALRQGAADFLAKPVPLLDLEAVVQKCARLRTLQLRQQRLQQTVRGLQAEKTERFFGRSMVGDSEALDRLRQTIQRAVDGSCRNLLITGETGAGKEMVARTFHHFRQPPDAPFITVSCPAISENQAESEFLGHVRGAFPGAIEHRPGCFEIAEGGTLFLDEIGDLSAAAQAKLLRVLETGRVRRLGSSQEVQTDVTVVAATHAPLAKLVSEGDFRQDLYYRLNAFTIHVPPLRERPEDIVPIAEHFLRQYGQEQNQQLPGFDTEAKRNLQAYPYPGNARELRNVVERAAILSQGSLIMAHHLNLGTGDLAMGAAAPQAANVVPPDEKTRILEALEQTRWNRKEASSLLRMPYSTLRYKIKKYDLG